MLSSAAFRGAAVWRTAAAAPLRALRLFPVANRGLSSKIEYPVVDPEKEKEYAQVNTRQNAVTAVEMLVADWVDARLGLDVQELEDVRKMKERKAAIRGSLVGKVVSTKAAKSITVLVSYHK